MARISPIKQQSVERTEAELEELAEQLIALKGQFHQKIINKDIALKFAKELKDMSVFINGCYSTRTPPPKRYSCGVGYQSPDENELLLGTLVKDVIMKKMHLPSNPKKEDMFHYMVHSTVVHMLRCSSDGAITLHFNPELLTEWKRIYVNNRHDPALDNPYEAVLVKCTYTQNAIIAHIQCFVPFCVFCSCIVCDKILVHLSCHWSVVVDNTMFLLLYFQLLY